MGHISVESVGKPETHLYFFGIKYEAVKAKIQSENDQNYVSNGTQNAHTEVQNIKFS